MFTGLIEAVCEVRSMAPAVRGAGKLLRISLNTLCEGTRIGDSVAINGVCLTVNRLESPDAWFDVSPETLSKSTLGTLRAGSRVNTERALRIGDRLGGHFVQGHVDGRGTIRTIHQQGDFWELTVGADAGLLHTLVPQGSVAVEGVSLTVARLNQRDFTLAIIPETARRTTLSLKTKGDPVNLETDMLVKAVRRTCEKLFEQNPGRSVNRDRKFGF
jgi:riboflavin synthase